MKYPCNLIRDILPLYHDGVASEESIAAVTEHLSECNACKEYYSQMCGSDTLETVYDEQMARKAADSYKRVQKKLVRKIGKVIGVTVVVVVLLIAVLYAALVGYLHFSAEATREIHRDIREYAYLEDGSNVLELFSDGGETGECIWPKEIKNNMDVQDYLLVYYCPWDSNYLGYLTVSYEEAEYEAEEKRLTAYPSTEYIGNYGATGFAQYEVLAMDAGDYGFVYALTDGKETIIYVLVIFPGYGMDIDYEAYLPKEYLPEGLDAGKDNPTRQKMVERFEETKNR